MSDKLTSLTGFGEGDPKPEKKDAPRRNPFGGGGDWDYGASAARASKDKNNKLYSGGAKSSALNKKMGKESAATRKKKAYNPFGGNTTHPSIG